MELNITAPNIWLASEPVDFRKSIDGLTAILASKFERSVGLDVVVFYNRARNKIKLLALHQSGSLLIYKRLHQRKFTFIENEQGLYQLTTTELSWLLAGLDWQAMSQCKNLEFDDYF